MQRAAVKQNRNQLTIV